MTPAERLAHTYDAEFWRAMAPDLHIGATIQRTFATQLAAEQLAAEQLRIRTEGWASFERIIAPDLALRLAAGIRCLVEANIPTPFIYVFDEAWEVAAGLAGLFDAIMCGDASLWPDVWAWFIPARDGLRGWAPHRGVTFDVRSTDGAPTLVNVWIALSDVTTDSACMHVVPFGSDPHYPHALERVDVPASLGVALPVPTGSVLAWNANVLHWSGRMSADAVTPRVAMSFTVGREPGADHIDPTRGLSFEARVDLIADMLVTYESVAQDVPAEWREWARLSRGMRLARRS